MDATSLGPRSLGMGGSSFSPSPPPPPPASLPRLRLRLRLQLGSDLRAGRVDDCTPPACQQRGRGTRAQGQRARRAAGARACEYYARLYMPRACCACRCTRDHERRKVHPQAPNRGRVKMVGEGGGGGGGVPANDGGRDAKMPVSAPPSSRSVRVSPCVSPARESDLAERGGRAHVGRGRGGESG